MLQLNKYFFSTTLRSSMVNKTEKKKKIQPAQVSKPSKKPCNSFNPSAEMLLCTLRPHGTTKFGGGSDLKQTTTADKLSPLFLLSASLTSSLLHKTGSLCSCSFLLAKSTAF
ncbi:hypothetical protein Hanom_Chr08g00728991 [Helianthus anomalus]